MWSGLPERVLSATTVFQFEKVLDRFWAGHEILYTYKADLRTLGSLYRIHTLVLYNPMPVGLFVNRVESVECIHDDIL